MASPAQDWQRIVRHYVRTTTTCTYIHVYMYVGKTEGGTSDAEICMSSRCGYYGVTHLPRLFACTLQRLLLAHLWQAKSGVVSFALALDFFM